MLCDATLIRRSIGSPPFCSENAHDTYRKIIDWKNQLYFPEDVRLSAEAVHLIKKCAPVASMSFCRERG